MVGAIGQPDNFLGEVPCAYVELIEGSTVHSEELIKFAQEKLDNKLAMPVYIETLSELPKTPVGKIFKPELRKRAITRIFNAELANQNVKANVHDVVEDNINGLTAIIAVSSDTDLDAIGDSLNQFIVPWQKL